jgi:hypothetical protein
MRFFAPGGFHGAHKILICPRIDARARDQLHAFQNICELRNRVFIRRTVTGSTLNNAKQRLFS